LSFPFFTVVTRMIIFSREACLLTRVMLQLWTGVSVLYVKCSFENSEEGLEESVFSTHSSCPQPDFWRKRNLLVISRIFWHRASRRNRFWKWYVCDANLPKHMYHCRHTYAAVQSYPFLPQVCLGM
jgi:hypothetical protein